MKNKGIPKLAFNSLDRITDLFPSFGQRIFQKAFLYLLGSSYLYNFNLNRYRKKLMLTKDFSNILIVGDVNIGDSLITQSCVVLLKSFFPESRVDYVCNKIGGELIFKSPIVDDVYKLYKKSGLPTDGDITEIKEVVDNGSYTLILNFSPFISKKVLNCKANVVHVYLPFAYYIVNLWKNNYENLNISRATHVFIQNLFETLMKSIKPILYSDEALVSKTEFEGNSIYISHEAKESAREFLIANKLYRSTHILLYNPFVTSKFSMIPIKLQIDTIKYLLLSNNIKTILMYEGNSEYNLEKTILEKLPKELTGKIVRIPNTLSIETFAALIDYCDMFFSGDTGTVHVAASRKIPRDPNDTMRNRTSVVSVYGASDSRMYGYDSEEYGHEPANQDVPSKSFVGSTPCRTITCINRLVKTCREIRCFNGLEADDIAAYIINYFHNIEYSNSISKFKEAI